MGVVETEGAPWDGVADAREAGDEVSKTLGRGTVGFWGIGAAKVGLGGTPAAAAAVAVDVDFRIAACFASTSARLAAMTSAAFCTGC